MSITTPPSKKSAFISYAHKDNINEFVRWLDFSLGLYADVFWDIKLQAGSWEKQLKDKVELSDFLLVVMSHHQGLSKWCQHEIEWAINANKVIIPIKRFATYSDEKLSHLQIADFSRDIFLGFQELTYMMYKVQLQSWEVLHNYNDEDLLNALREGLLPALISKEISDWVIVNPFWSAFLQNIGDKKVAEYMLPSPRTPSDIWRVMRYLKDLLIENANNRQFDFISINETEKALEALEKLLKEQYRISDESHKKAGEFAEKIITVVFNYITESVQRKGQFLGLRSIVQTYSFNIASKVRELITIHARRSRYLY